MPYRAVRLVVILTTAAAVAVVVSCGPQPPKPGTPAFKWFAAHDAYKKGDYDKANDLLVQVAKSDNEFTAKARPWTMLLSQAMVNGYYELSDEYLKAAEKAKRNPAAFRRLVNICKSKAAAAGMSYAEVSKAFLDSNKDQDVTLAFDIPDVSLDADPPQYKKLEEGTMLDEPEITQAERFVIRREVASAICQAMNAGEDVAKAKAAYQQGEAKIPGPVFQMNTAQTLYDIGEMFGPKKLYQPDRVRSVIYETSLQALAFAKDDKAVPALKKKISESSKKLQP